MMRNRAARNGGSFYLSKSVFIMFKLKKSNKIIDFTGYIFSNGYDYWKIISKDERNRYERSVTTPNLNDVKSLETPSNFFYTDDDIRHLISIYSWQVVEES